MKTLTKQLVASLAALSLALGATSASAETTTLTDAALKSALEASNAQAVKTGFVTTSPSMLLGMQTKAIYSPGENNVPANTAVVISLMGTTAASLMNLSQSNPLNPMGDALDPVGNGALDEWQNYVDPDAGGLVIGQESVDGFVLDEYSVTRPAENQIAVHFAGHSETQTEPDGTPYSEESDLIFTLENQLITSIAVTTTAEDYIDEGQTKIEYRVPEIQREFGLAISAWKSTHFEFSSMPMVDRLIKAFKSSKAAALKSGMTMKSTSKVLPGFALYEPKSKKSVIVQKASGKPTAGVGFTGAPNVFDDAFAVALGIDVFTGAGSLQFTSKTNTYKLKGVNGQAATIKLNSQGRITSISSVLFGGPSLDYSFTYATDKTLWSKWGAGSAKTQQLMQWIINAKDELGTTKVVFKKSAGAITATGAKGAKSTFKTTGMKATQVADLFKLLGFVLT